MALEVKIEEQDQAEPLTVLAPVSANQALSFVRTAWAKTGALRTSTGAFIPPDHQLEGGATYHFLADTARQSEDDASAKNLGGSPKRSLAEAKTVALGGSEVLLGNRFPHIKPSPEPFKVSLTLEEDVMEFLSRKLLEPVFRALLTSSGLEKEASRVHVLGQMLQLAVIMLPKYGMLDDAGNATMVEGPSQADNVEVHRSTGSEGQDEVAYNYNEMAYEKYIRAGSFKGRMELQVVRSQKSGKVLFVGAVEAKCGELGPHYEQAKKEAFAMWCHNALQEHYEATWVVLSNVLEVVRITYIGKNYPGGGGKNYFKKMPCVLVEGDIIETRPYPLAHVVGTTVRTIDYEGVQVFLSGLLGPGMSGLGDTSGSTSGGSSSSDGDMLDTSVSALEQRLKDHTAAMQGEITEVLRLSTIIADARQLSFKKQRTG